MQENEILQAKLLVEEHKVAAIKQFHSPDEVAQRWGVDKKIVYNEIKSGNLKAMRIGAKILRVSAAELQSYEQKFLGGER